MGTTGEKIRTSDQCIEEGVTLYYILIITLS